MATLPTLPWTVTDRAAGNLATAIGPAATAFDFEVGDGAEFPAATFACQIGQETLFVGTRTGDSCTGVLRGQAGTTATIHPAGQRIVLTFNKAYFDHLIALIQGHTHALGEVGIVRAVKAADQAFSATAFANDNTLALAVGANETRSFVFEGTYVTALAATGLQLSVTGPAGQADIKFGGTIAETATTSRYGAGTAYDTPVAALASAGATPMPWRLSGTITTGATAGNITLRVRSETNGSAVTIQRGSSGTLF